MLELKDVNQYYGGSHILRNVSIDAKIGEITVVLGRNGVGFVPQGREIFGRLTVEDKLNSKSQTADPRRTYRRHSTQRHQGYWPRTTLTSQPQNDGDFAGRIVLRFRRRTGRPVDRDGARRSHQTWARFRHGIRWSAWIDVDLAVVVLHNFRFQKDRRLR